MMFLNNGANRVLLGVKRIYEKASITDGRRILVDRLWPRGVRRSTSNIDIWMKEIAPSEELRRWFNHDPGKWVAFKKRYWEEIKGKNIFKALQARLNVEDVTLVFASSDERHNNAIALASFLKSHAAKPKKADISRKIAEDLAKEAGVLA